MFIRDGIAYAGELTDGIKLVSAKVTGTLTMLIEFSTGEWRVFDAQPLLGQPVFHALEDPQVFAAFTIDHGVLCWLDGAIDLSPEYLYKASYAYDRTA